MVRTKKRPSNCVGLTPQNVLVIVTENSIHYTSLTKSLSDNVRKEKISSQETMFSKVADKKEE
jgi:hypothetical protein